MKIFVSYRRDDSRLATERLCDHLINQFGTDAILKDVDLIPLGADFRTELNRAIATCDVLIVVIGDNWLIDPAGKRRLDDKNDWVRIEIETALQRGIPLIPVLVNVAEMPSVDRLPNSLQQLTFCQSAVIRSDPDFHRDVHRLVKVLIERSMDKIIEYADTASGKSLLGSLDENELIRKLSETLCRDPRNIHALIMRGQFALIHASQPNGKGYGQVMQDFRAAGKINSQLADPHYGLGTIYYNLAMLDIVKRERYEVHSKGKMRINPRTSIPEMLYPGFELFLDKQSKSQFDLSLDEFQTGQQLRQTYSEEQGISHVFFAPRDVENRIRSLRSLLGYAPMTTSDDWMVQVFTTCMTRLNPEVEIFEFVKSNAEDMKKSVKRWWQLWK